MTKMTKQTRREFLIATGSISAVSLLGKLPTVTAQAQSPAPAGHVPWYETCYRWGLTNLSLKDMETLDVGFWREQWRRNATQAIIVNGVAGFVTFPSRNPLLDRSRFAPNRDVFGEINEAAKADGIHVLARMESGSSNARISERFADYRTVGANGQRGGICVNSPFRREHVFEVYGEIMERYKVVGYTDNSGVGASLCYCPYCTAKWNREVGGELPRTTSLEDPGYRRWRRWSEKVVLEIWDDMNAFAKRVGGPDCVYISYIRMGATNGRDISARIPFLMMDCQSRNDSYSFSEHVDEARYIRSFSNWQKKRHGLLGALSSQSRLLPRDQRPCGGSLNVSEGGHRRRL